MAEADDFDPEAYQRERDARDLAILEAADAGVDVASIAGTHDLTTSTPTPPET